MEVHFSPGHRWVRPLLLIVAVVLLLSLGAVAVAGHYLEAILLHVAHSRTGRHIRVEGAFESRWLSHWPHIAAAHVTIGNPPWMPAGDTAQIGRLVIELRWRAAWPPLEVRELKIEEATLHLVRTSDGRANWQSVPRRTGPGPPLIRSLVMADAQVELQDDRGHLNFRGVASAGDVAGTGRGPAPLRIEARGVLNGRPMTLRIDGEPLATAQRSVPYRFFLDERSSGSRLTGHGQLERPFDFGVLQGSFEASGEDMRDLYFLIGLRFPDTGRYRLSGRLARQRMRFLYSNLTASSGASDMEGTLRVDSSSGRPYLSGELHSRLLRLEDLGARAAGRAPAEHSQAGLIIPQRSFRLEGIRREEAAVTFDANTFEIGAATFHGLALDLAIHHGRLSLRSVRASLGEGRVEGGAQLDATREVPASVLDLHARDVPIESLMPHRPSPLVTGPLDARVHLEGEGQSLHELVASASGQLAAVMPRGSMRALIPELASLSITGTLGALLHHREQTAIRCGVADFIPQRGVLAIRTFLLDTDKGLVGATGEVQLKSESLDITVQGRPAHRGITLHSAVAITGTLRFPHVALARNGSGTRAERSDLLRTPHVTLDAALRYVDPALAANPGCAPLLTELSGAAAAAPAMTSENDIVH